MVMTGLRDALAPLSLNTVLDMTVGYVDIRTNQISVVLGVADDLWT